MRLHTGDNLLVCGVCQKRFTSKYAILHHVAVHTGEKPFQCAVCEKQFTQPANLRTHVKKKHGNNLNNQNKCDFCGLMLSSITSLHQHLLDIHKGHVEKGRVISDNMKMKMEPKFTTSDVFIQKESANQIQFYALMLFDVADPSDTKSVFSHQGEKIKPI